MTELKFHKIAPARPKSQLAHFQQTLDVLRFQVSTFNKREDNWFQNQGKQTGPLLSRKILLKQMSETREHKKIWKWIENLQKLTQKSLSSELITGQKAILISRNEQKVNKVKKLKQRSFTKTEVTLISAGHYRTQNGTKYGVRETLSQKFKKLQRQVESLSTYRKQNCMPDEALKFKLRKQTRILQKVKQSLETRSKWSCSNLSRLNTNASISSK